MPEVSIIMPSYNSQSTISESINSVLSQTYEDWELLITDDKSTDNTINIIKSFKDSRITLYCLEKNRGAGIARNNSIKHAQGRYIAFLDADDLWMPQKLEKQIKFMKENNYSLTYSHYKKFDSNGDKGIVVAPPNVTYNQMIFSNVIGCLTAIYDTRTLGKRYMPPIRKRQDMALWLNILETCGKAYAFPEVLAKYRTDVGMTSNKFKILKWQWAFYRRHLKFSIPKTIYVFMFYSLKGLAKKII